MRLVVRSLLLALFLAVPVLGAERAELAAVAARFQEHVNYLASDELEGRGVGSKGIELAAAYIAAQFEQAGLDPAGESGTYYQPFEVALQRKLTDHGRLVFGGLGNGQTGGTDAAPPRAAGDAPLALRKDFIPFAFSSDEAFTGPVAFAGYGIVAADSGAPERDDFVHLDATGKVVLMFRGEPPDWADADGNPTHHAMFRNKVYNAKDRGAVAVLIVNPAPAEGEADALMEFEEHGAEQFGIPAMHVTRAVAERVLQSGGLGTLAALQEKLDAGGYASADLKDVTAEGQAGIERQTSVTRNVLGLLRGEGSLAEECVVIGAHYDHLGNVKPMLRTFKAGKLVQEESGPQIHNGADDNASGVAGLIEIARQMAEGSRPKRSVLFIAFTAEEAGLHGSKHYVDHPAVPLEKTVAMLNMDMIGRLPADGDTVQVFGVPSAAEFGQILDSAAGQVGLKIAPSPDTGGRSDHAPFIRQRIPALHFFTGQHADYHKPSDDADKINAAGAARVVSVVQQAAAELANRDARPAYQEVKIAQQDTAGGTPTFRVVMGLAPSYGDDGKPGMLVDAVNPEGPADLAGMKTGDRILSIGGKKVANIYDYMAATRGNNPGDVVDVVVQRGEEQVTLKVTLSAAR